MTGAGLSSRLRRGLAAREIAGASQQVVCCKQWACTGMYGQGGQLRPAAPSLHADWRLERPTGRGCSVPTSVCGWLAGSRDSMAPLEHAAGWRPPERATPRDGSPNVRAQSQAAAPAHILYWVRFSGLATGLATCAHVVLPWLVVARRIQLNGIAVCWTVHFTCTSDTESSIGGETIHFVWVVETYQLICVCDVSESWVELP